MLKKCPEQAGQKMNRLWYYLASELEVLACFLARKALFSPEALIAANTLVDFRLL